MPNSNLTWAEAREKIDYANLEPEAQAYARERFFQKHIAPGIAPEELGAAWEYALPKLLDSGQGIAAAMGSSALRGVTRVAADIPGGLGYLTDSQELIDLGDSIEGGINKAFPINPALANSTAVTIAGAVGQAGSMLLTGGAGGFAGKALGAARIGAEIGALGTGIVSGARQGGQTADEYGMEGLSKALTIGGFGALEFATEKIPFGAASETAAVRSLLGDVIEKPAVSAAGDILSNTAEEGISQVGQNLTVQALAPQDAEKPLPGTFEGLTDSLIGGAAGGAFFAGVNALTAQPRTTAIDGKKYHFDGKIWSRIADGSEGDLESMDERGLIPVDPSKPGQAAILETLKTTPPPEGLSEQIDLNGKSFIRSPSGQWHELNNPTPLNPDEPAESAAIAQLDLKWTRERVKETAKTEAQPATTPAESAPQPVVTLDDLLDIPEDTTPEIAPPTTPKPRLNRDTLIDETGADLISSLQGDRIRLKPGTGSEWDWYRELQTAARTAKPFNAHPERNRKEFEARLSRGDVSHPAVLLAWVNDNLIDTEEGANIDEVADSLNGTSSVNSLTPETVRQTFDVDAGSLGVRILEAIAAREQARERGGFTRLAVEMETETVAAERESEAAFLAHAVTSTGAEVNGLSLAQDVEEGSIVTIAGKDFTAEFVDSNSGIVTLSNPEVGSATIYGSDNLRVDAIDGQAKQAVVDADIEDAPFSPAKLKAQQSINEAELAKLNLPTKTAQRVWGKKPVRAALLALSEDTRLPANSRMMAKMLAGKDLGGLFFSVHADGRLPWAGQYQPYSNGTGEIMINVRSIGFGNVNESLNIAETIIHEALHHVTYRAIRAPKNSVQAAAIKNLNALRARARAILGARGDTSFDYQLSTTDEFISALFTQREFQIMLAGIPADQTPRGIIAKVRSMLDELFRTIAELVTGTAVPPGSVLDIAFSNSLSLIEDANVALLPGGGLISKSPGLQIIGAGPLQLPAYHGTPHKVDKFSRDKIGTGEGRGAYGHGLYFAESRDVAEQYRRNLSALANNARTFENPLTIQQARKRWGQGLDVFIEGTGIVSWEPRFLDPQTPLYEPNSEEITGNLYTVELLPDAGDFLDWDKPLSEQSEKVKAAVSQIIAKAAKSFPALKQSDPTGAGAYTAYSNHRGGNAKAVSEELASLGIPGIRYLDGNSRDGGSGTSNYVIFDESLVKILEENGKPVQPADALQSPNKRGLGRGLGEIMGGAAAGLKPEAKGLENQAPQAASLPPQAAPSLSRDLLDKALVASAGAEGYRGYLDLLFTQARRLLSPDRNVETRATDAVTVPQALERIAAGENPIVIANRWSEHRNNVATGKTTEGSPFVAGLPLPQTTASTPTSTDESEQRLRDAYATLDRTGQGYVRIPDLARAAGLTPEETRGVLGALDDDGRAFLIPADSPRDILDEDRPYLVNGPSGKALYVTVPLTPLQSPRADMKRNYQPFAAALGELRAVMKRAKSSRDERTVDGEVVPETVYNVRTDANMRIAGEAVLDEMNNAQFGGEDLLNLLREGNHEPSGQAMQLGERAILIRTLLQTGRNAEFGLTKSDLLRVGQEIIGDAFFAGRNWREVLDPITRLKDEADTRADEELAKVAGVSADDAKKQLDAEVLKAQTAALEEAVREAQAELRESQEQLRKEREQAAGGDAAEFAASTSTWQSVLSRLQKSTKTTGIFKGLAGLADKILGINKPLQNIAQNAALPARDVEVGFAVMVKTSIAFGEWSAAVQAELGERSPSELARLYRQSTERYAAAVAELEATLPDDPKPRTRSKVAKGDEAYAPPEPAPATIAALSEALRETRAKLREVQAAAQEEKARADQEREVGVNIGREEGRAAAEAEQAAKPKPDPELDRFESWLMGEKNTPGLEGLESIEKMASRYIQPSRWNREGFADLLRSLFPTLDENILSDAADRMNETIENKLAAARRSAITAFVDRIAERPENASKKKAEHLDKFLNSLKRASDFGILDSDVFIQAFASAFDLNGLTAARVQQLVTLWQQIQQGKKNVESGNYGMVGETLEREFKEAVNAVAPAARWDNAIFNQYQAGVLSSVSSIINQFSAMWRLLSPLDAMRRGFKKGDAGALMRDWLTSYSDLVTGSPLFGLGVNGESLGHLPSEVKGTFTPQEQQLQLLKKGASFRVQGPIGGVMTLAPSTTAILRAKELWAWRLIRGAEGVTGILDARNNFMDVLVGHYRSTGMSASKARKQAAKDVASTPEDVAHAESQARREQSEGLIGKGITKIEAEAAVARRIEEIIQRVIDTRLGVDLSARAEQLTAYMNFKTEPLGLGWYVSKMMSAFIPKDKKGNPEHIGRVTRFFFLFGRFLGHTLDATTGYLPVLHFLNMFAATESERGKAIAKVFGDQKQFNREQNARAMAGGSFMLLTGMLAVLAQALKDDEDDEAIFEVTGTLPGATRDEKERLKASGKWTEGSVKIGPARLNYSQMPEIAPLLSIVGNLSDWLRFGSAAGGTGGEPLPASAAGFTFTLDALAAPIKRSTYKQWVEAISIAFGASGGSTDPQSASARLEESLANLFTAPVGGILRLPVLVDVDKASRLGEAKDAQGWTENLLRRVPFAHVGETMVNAYGEKSPGFPFFNLQAEPLQDNANVTKAAKINLDTGTVRRKPQDVGETREERLDYQILAGQLYRQTLVANEKLIREKLSAGDTAEVERIIEKIGSEANEVAKAQLWPEIYGEGARIEEDKAKRAAAKARRDAIKAEEEATGKPYLILPKVKD